MGADTAAGLPFHIALAERVVKDGIGGKDLADGVTGHPVNLEYLFLFVK